MFAYETLWQRPWLKTCRANPAALGDVNKFAGFVNGEVWVPRLRKASLVNQRLIEATPWRFERVALTGGHWLQTLQAGPRQEAPTLLLIHGAAGSWHNFRLQIQWLQAGYRVVSVDLRGHGISPWPGKSRIEDFVDDLSLLIEKRVSGPLALLGHSFGGCLATHLAVRFAGRVRGLALLNTSGHIHQGAVFRFLRRFSRFSHWVAQVEPYWISCHGSVAHTLLWDTLPGWNTWPLFPQVRVPSLVISGKRDLLMPWRDCQRMAESLPFSRFHCIQDGRHVCMWEHPQLVRDQLEAWLAQIDWGRG